MIKNYIFDLGQVMVHFDPFYMAGAYVTDEADRKLVAETVFDRLYWDRLDDGTISDDEVKTAVCGRLPGRLHAAACLAYDRWMENIPAMEGMPELTAEIKQRGGKLYLLSNVGAGFGENYRNVPALEKMLSDFDGLVISGAIGLVKPDPAIYRYVLDTYGLRAEECVFIDDRDKNVTSAETVGIRSYRFDGDTEKLREYLMREW